MTRTLRRSPRAAIFLIGFLAALSLVSPGCSRSTSSGPGGSSGSVQGGAGGRKIIVVQSSDQRIGADLAEKDILDGLKAEGFASKSFELVTLDTQGKTDALPGLIDEALARKPTAVVVLHPQALKLAMEKTKEIPIIFGLTVWPKVVGLDNDPIQRKNHPNVTGAYGAFDEPDTRGCALLFGVKPTKIGILWTPDDPISVVWKEKFLAFPPAAAITVAAEFHSAEDLASATQSLLDQKATVLYLMAPLGKEASAATKLAHEAKVPVLGISPEHLRAGAVFARIPRPRWIGFEVGRRLGKVLKDQKPEAIPYLLGPDYLNCVNPTASKLLGITVPGMLTRDGFESVPTSES